MKERMTRGLLAAVGVLLAARLLRPVPAPVEAVEAGEVTAVLRARMFELVDERGQVRANLKLEPDGQVVLRLRDSKGEVRVKLGADENGSGLVLMDDRTEPGAHLLATRAGTKLTLAEKGKEKQVMQPGAPSSGEQD